MFSRRSILAQFRCPSGTLGALAGWIMARRRSNRARNAWMVELLALRPDDQVLEIGFGPGLAIAAAAARVTDGYVLGLDHSAAMLRQASARNHAAIAAGTVDLRLGDTADLHSDPARFTAAMSANVVQFWNDKGAAYHRLIGALAPGGRIVTVYQPRHAKATSADADAMADCIADAMDEAGFTAIERRILRLSPVPAIAVIGRRP